MVEYQPPVDDDLFGAESFPPGDPLHFALREDLRDRKPREFSNGTGRRRNGAVSRDVEDLVAPVISSDERQHQK